MCTEDATAGDVQFFIYPIQRCQQNNESFGFHFFKECRRKLIIIIIIIITILKLYTCMLSVKIKIRLNFFNLG